MLCVQKRRQESSSDLEKTKDEIEVLKEQIAGADMAIQEINSKAAQLEKERDQVITCSNFTLLMSDHRASTDNCLFVYFTCLFVCCCLFVCVCKESKGPILELEKKVDDCAKVSNRQN